MTVCLCVLRPSLAPLELLQARNNEDASIHAEFVRITLDRQRLIETGFADYMHGALACMLRQPASVVNAVWYLMLNGCDFAGMEQLAAALSVPLKGGKYMSYNDFHFLVQAYNKTAVSRDGLDDRNFNLF